MIGEVTMKYAEIKPSPALAEYVKCYWYLEKDYSDSDETIWPDGCIDVIIQSGERFRHGEEVLPTSFVIGPLKRPLAFASEGSTRVIGIRFFAYGAYPFLRMPICELADGITELGALLGGKADALSRQITDMPFLEACRLLEAFLLTRMAERTTDVRLIRMATELIYRHCGVIDIDALAQQVNWSQRSLERKFTVLIGQSAKMLARIVRFDQIKNALIFNPTLSLTELAHHYLYFDQAHFTRDFQQFTAQTPTAFAKKVAAHQIYFYK